MMLLHVQKVAGISGSEAHLLQLLPDLKRRGWDIHFLMLHENEPDIAHGAIAAERLIITPGARVIVVEHVLASALEQLRFSHERYWKELRVALPVSVGLPRFDEHAAGEQILRRKVRRWKPEVVAFVGEVEQFEDVADDGFAAAAGDLVRDGEEVQKLPDFHAVVDAEVVGHVADAFANAAGVVLDTFQFADLHHTLELNPSEIERFRKNLADVVNGKRALEPLLQSRDSATRARPPKIVVDTGISFDDSSSLHSTLLEIVAQDRPGLLYAIGSALVKEECNIEVALIDTEGLKAIDVFYVTSRGKKLTEQKKEALRQALRI